MCGISGLLVAEHMRDGVVDEQLRLLHHRGPDAAGAFARRHAVVAQNRLAIIDLVDGDPPIHTEDGAIGVVLNGEIYNYRGLREQLTTAGTRLQATATPRSSPTSPRTTSRAHSLRA